MDTAPIASPTPAAPVPAKAPAIASDYETFLRMLTVQMRNQDPLNPIDSADYAVQLATFSGVEQQVRTNELLDAISGQLLLSGLAGMSGWVGREVRAPVPAWFGGAPVTISPNPPAIADEVELVVRDAEGQEIERRAIPVSSDPIEWAGVDADGHPRPAGLYSFEVVSRAGGDVIARDPAEVYVTVTEVRAEGGRTVLVTRGGPTVAADAVTAIRGAA